MGAVRAAGGGAGGGGGRGRRRRGASGRAPNVDVLGDLVGSPKLGCDCGGEASASLTVGEVERGERDVDPRLRVGGAARGPAENEPGAREGRTPWAARRGLDRTGPTSRLGGVGGGCARGEGRGGTACRGGPRAHQAQAKWWATPSQTVRDQSTRMPVPEVSRVSVLIMRAVRGTRRSQSQCESCATAGEAWRRMKG